ncbi:MAG TPA: YceD family protein [Burkholderiales bacterium]|nr:YceD family protein [Burkholderiales bacterium]
MPQPQPVIDGFEFASAGASLRGALPIRDFPRLNDMLARHEGEVAYEIEGLRDERGRPGLRLKVRARLELRCQRCLEGLPFEVQADEVLVLAGTQAEIDAEPADVHAADRVVAAKEMSVRELVEDELILALPYAPRHAVCSARASTDAAEKVSPFAGLRGLMRGKH